MLQISTCRRRNVVSAAIVEAAIKIRTLLDDERATALLVRENVPASVIARVLAGDADRLRTRAHRSTEAGKPAAASAPAREHVVA
jgi:hypothetical protein